MLTLEQKVIFQEALIDAYKAGSQNATFLANSVYELTEDQSVSLEKVTKKYCED